MLNTYKLNVAVYDRTAAMEASPTYGKWAAVNGGPIRSLHILNVPYDQGEHKVHECLKEAVKSMGEPYFYQPQAQLQDREIIIKENRGCVIANRGNDEIVNLCKETLKNEVRSPCPPQCPAYVHSPNDSRHVRVWHQVARRFNNQKNVVVEINGLIGMIVVNDTTPLVLTHRIQMPLLERNGASYDLMVATSQNIDQEIGMMDRREMPSKSYAYMGSHCNYTYPTCRRTLSNAAC